MTTSPGAPQPDDAADNVDPGVNPDDVYDLDGDGSVSTIEAERARLGVVDARLEEIAEDGGIKGHLADAAHKLLDKLDND